MTIPICGISTKAQCVVVKVTNVVVANFCHQSQSVGCHDLIEKVDDCHLRLTEWLAYIALELFARYRSGKTAGKYWNI
ncbi:hypothetical protein D3C84_725280 [compost metagenome]